MAYRYILHRDELEPYMPRLCGANVIGVDTETTGLKPHEDRLRLVQIAVEGLPVLVIDCFSFLPKGQALFLELFQKENIVKVFQNAKFDLAFLYAQGIEIKPPIFDTMLAGGLLRSSVPELERLSLEQLALVFLGEEISKEEQVSDWSGALREEQLAYASLDAALLLRLREAMVPRIKREELVGVSRLEFACVHAIMQMEYNGVHLDLAAWHKLQEQMDTEREDALEQIYTYTTRPPVQPTFFGDEIVYGENLDSPKQVVELLGRNGIKVENASRHALLDHSEQPLVQAILRYRTASKLLGSFLEPIPSLIEPETSRLHPRYYQIGAWSGRMSCSRPNIQQIPRDKAFRACFTAPEGSVLVVADYSQIELRVLAEITGDVRMINAYRKGEDLHALTASILLDKPMEEILPTERQAAKAINFGLIYAMGAKGLMAYAQDTYGVPMTIEEAEQFRTRFFREYVGVANWHRALAREDSKEVRTLAGRKCMVGEDPPLSARSNTPIQGTAADILKEALGMLAKRIDHNEAKLIATVHDEILLEVRAPHGEKYCALLEKTMVAAGEKYLRKVPVVAEAAAAKNWAAKG